MHHCYNTNIRCSSKMCFLIALNEPDDIFDPDKVKKGQLWIGAVDNSIVPFKSSKSFTDDVAMFFSVCNDPYESSYYRISYPENTKPNFNALKYQFDALEQSCSKFNYMYHTTLFNDTTPISKDSSGEFFDDTWWKNSFVGLKAVMNVFGSTVEIPLGPDKEDYSDPNDYIFPKEYFKKTKTDLTYHTAFDISKTSMFEFYGVNNNGQVCHVTVPAPDEFINPMYFQKYIIDMFRKNKLIDYRIMNIGVLFNSNLKADYTDLDARKYIYKTIVSDFSLYKENNKLEDKIFNFDCFKTKVEVEAADDDAFKKRSTGFTETSMKTLEIVPANAYINGELMDEDPINLLGPAKYALYKDYIDYCELSNNKKSLYKAPQRPNSVNDMNSALPPGLDTTMLSKRCFVISSYKEKEKEKYITNCAQPIIETYSVFYEIEDENGYESIENIKTFSYSITMDNATLDNFPDIGAVSAYKKIAPMLAEWWTKEDLAAFKIKNDDVDPSTGEKWIEIRCLGAFADVEMLKDKLFGMYYISTGGEKNESTLTLTIRLDLDAICECMYDPKVVALRKLHMYSENWMISDVIAFLEAYTDFRLTAHNVATIATEYNLQCIVPGVADQNAFQLSELDNNHLILSIYKRTKSYEERTNKVLQLEYMFYDSEDGVDMLLNYNTTANNIEPISFAAALAQDGFLNEFKKGYVIPFNYFKRDAKTVPDYFVDMLYRYNDKGELEKRKIDSTYIRSIYKDYKDIHKSEKPKDPTESHVERYIYTKKQE